VERKASRGEEVVVARKARGRPECSTIFRLQEISKDLGKPSHLMYVLNGSESACNRVVSGDFDV
jgi:hypothetical protein